MFPVFTRPRGSTKAILLLYCSTSEPKLLRASTRDSFLGITRPLDTVEDATASPPVAGGLVRTRSAHDFGAGRGGETGLGVSSVTAEGSVGVDVTNCSST